MTILVTHTTPADSSFSTEGAAAWDANHALSGVGTMAEQNADSVDITGGAINGTAIGSTTPAAATFTTLTATGQTSLGGDAGSESLRVTSLSGTPNGWLEIKGSTTGTNGAYVTSSANSLYVSANNGSQIRFFSNGAGTAEQFRVSHTASAVNYVQVTGAATGSPPTISSQGSDSTVGLNIIAKSASIIFYTASGQGRQFNIAHTAGTIANYLQVTGSTTTNVPVLSSQGSDTNIDLALTPKGTGLVRFGTYTAGAPTATGYISIKAANGTTYKVLVGT